MARTKIKIDWKKVDKYLQAQCTGTGIASLLGISPDTLYNRCKKENKLVFSEYSAIKKGEGKELLRVKMFSSAMAGDKAMCIWLSKQYLEMRERQDVEHSGAVKIEGIEYLEPKK